MNGYSAKVKESSRELTAKEQMIMADTSDCTKLDKALADGAITIKPIMYVILAVHNEKSDSKDYEVYVIMDENGEKYTTGSQAFWSTFKNIWDGMSDSNEEWAVKIYHKESKNYNGKQFITCSVV